MYVYCKKCDYDSGDKDSSEELAEKVKKDGGQMEHQEDTKTGKSRGWRIICPKGHKETGMD